MSRYLLPFQVRAIGSSEYEIIKRNSEVLFYFIFPARSNMLMNSSWTGLDYYVKMTSYPALIWLIFTGVGGGGKVNLHLDLCNRPLLLLDC